MTNDNPFAPVLSRQSFLETIGAGEALRRLDDGLGTREPFLLVTGDPGIGKSALANEAIARWGSRVTAAYLAFPAATATELLEEILRRLGAEVPDGANRARLVACLEQALAEIAGRGQIAIVVVDDAHHLSPELLEELRLLVTAAQQAGRRLEVLLAGLPALEATLADPALAALRQRVSARAKLEPLSPGETRRYIRHRVMATGDDRSNLFPRKTCAEIAVVSGGVPREINAIAAEALRLARESGAPTVDVAHVRDAAAALSGVLPKGEVVDPTDTEPEVIEAPAPAPPPVSRPVTGAPAATAPARPAIPPAAAASKAPPPAAAPPPAPARPMPAPASPAPATRPAEPPAKIAGIASGAGAGELHSDEISPYDHVPPTSHDPHEWVARFIGDKGPIRIGSQAVSDSSWISREPADSGETATQPGEAPARPRRAAGGAPAPKRSRSGSGVRAVTTAVLAMVALITAVVLGLRALGSARSRAAKATGVSTSGHLAPQDENATSSRAPQESPPTGRAAAPAAAGDQGSQGSEALPRGPYTLEAAVRLDLRAALEERSRMQQLTGIEGWVAPSGESGPGTFRVVLGIYHSYARARAAADMLTKSKTLARVSVVTLPPRGTRQ